MVKVELFFNDTNGGSFRKGTFDHSDRRWQDYTVKAENGERDHVPMMDGYRHGDVLVKGSLEWLRDTEDFMALAWHGVAAANRDDRANGQTERSFSKGDVFRVTKADGKVVWLASTGYELVEVAMPEVVYG